MKRTGPKGVEKLSMLIRHVTGHVYNEEILGFIGMVSLLVMRTQWTQWVLVQKGQLTQCTQQI